MNPRTYLKARRAINLAALLLWMLVIFLGSSTPQEEIPAAISPIAKILHFTEYAVLGFLMLPYVSESRRPLLYAVLFCSAYASSDEFHQLFVRGRHGSPYDVVIDAFGSSAGAYLSERWGRI
jgi:VanZ family protein